MGMLGLETALSVVQHAVVDTGLLDWAGVADRMSCAPARIGRVSRATARPLEPGAPANVTLVDPAASRVVDPADSRVDVAQHAVPGDARSRARWSRRSCAVSRPSSTGSCSDRADPALLVLEDGRTFHGEAYGAVGETVGEAVFSTGMTGYQETLTDPSYHGQVVVMTAPHIGNTGVNDEDGESRRIWVAGYVVRDPRRWPSTGDPPARSTTSFGRKASSASAASTPAR